MFADLREPVAAYLAEYGHREVRSAFLMSEPTWGEMPALLYAGIHEAVLDRPEATGESGERVAAAAADRVRARRRVRLTGSADAILAAAAPRVRHRVREDTHFHATRGSRVLRARCSRPVDGWRARGCSTSRSTCCT